MLVPVRFLRGHPPYNANDVAGFKKARADQFVKAGVASYLTKDLGGAAPVAKEAPAKEVPAEEPADEEEPPKRKRGRPRKDS